MNAQNLMVVGLGRAALGIATALALQACGAAPVPDASHGTAPGTAGALQANTASASLTSPPATASPSTPSQRGDTATQANTTPAQTGGAPAIVGSGPSSPSATNPPQADQTDGQDAAQTPGSQPISMVPGLDVLGVRVGMPVNEAIAVLKAKGITLEPLSNGGPKPVGMQTHDAAFHVWLTVMASPQVVRGVDNSDHKRMVQATVLSALRTKYGAHGVDVAQGTKEGCLKTVKNNVTTTCKENLAYEKDSNPQHLQACIDAREKEAAPGCNNQSYPPDPSHEITWHYDELGHPLSQEAFERYCPKAAPACKAITVAARIDASDADRAVPGFSIRLWSDWMQKRDDDEQRRQQALAEKKNHEKEMNSVRRNQPQL